jgi:hypothetical protein
MGQRASEHGWPQAADVLQLSLDDERELHERAVRRLVAGAEALIKAPPSRSRESMRRLPHYSPVIRRRRMALLPS